MDLYKVANKNPYYFWSVMSLVLQAIEGEPKLAKSVHLPLALRMVQKQETAGRMEQEQEVGIRMFILNVHCTLLCLAVPLPSCTLLYFR